MVMPLNLGLGLINDLNDLNAYWIVAERDTIKDVFSNNWKKIAIIDFLKYFFSFKLKRIDHPFHFVKDFINYIVLSNSK